MPGYVQVLGSSAPEVRGWQHNHPANLEIVTKSENCQHATHVLGQNRGEEHGRAILTEEDVQEIRKLWEEKELTGQEIADAFGTHWTNICNMVAYRIWKHV